MINFYLIKKNNWKLIKKKFDECWWKKKKEEYKLFNWNCEVKYRSMDTDRGYNNVFIICLFFDSILWFGLRMYWTLLRQNEDFILKWNLFCFLKFYFYTFCTLKTIYISVCSKIANAIISEILATVCFIISD